MLGFETTIAINGEDIDCEVDFDHFHGEIEDIYITHNGKDVTTESGCNQVYQLCQEYLWDAEAGV